MRADSVLRPTLSFYHAGSIVGRLLIWTALLISAAGVVIDLGLLPRGGWLSFGTTLILAAALALWRVADRRFRQEIALADLRREESLALAHQDALTGVHSRAYFLKELKGYDLGRRNVPVGYLQLDMDHLKAVNDTMGHAAGDAVLRILVDKMRRRLPEAIIGRLGGDEFGIAVIGQGNKQALLRLAGQLLRDLAEEVTIGGRKLHLSATIGLATAPDDTDDMVELMSWADLALYRGKQQGRAMAVPYDDDMLGDERYARNLLRELRGALLLDEIKVHYQPLYSVDGKTLKSYEALVRWHHSHRGVIMPSEFIPFAEKAGLIDRLGDEVLAQVCRDLPKLGVPVAVNVSPVQLRRHDYAERVLDTLLEAGVSPRDLVVEVTESVLMHANGAETQNLEAIRQAGIRVAIDDLGTGHASLEYLRSFAFDIIKIDRSYIGNMLNAGVDRVLVAAICEIGQVLGVEVIAEGVETEAQLAALRDVGCSAAQGYLLGRPKPLADIDARQRSLPPAA